MYKNIVNILFAATSDYIPYALTTALSVKENLNENYDLHITYLYADIIKPISDEERDNYIEYSKYCYKENNININYINVEQYMHLFEGQNVGLWDKPVSMTHYMYLLAPMILTDINKIIYLDTDMIVNTDLSAIYNIDLDNYLLAMGAPRGQEEMGNNVCNSGFVFLNLEKWRSENVLHNLLDFGRKLPKARFCDQYLLHQYFTLNHSDRLLLLDSKLNIFPQLFLEIPLEDIKIFHYTGWKNIPPRKDIDAKARGGFLWWKYARKTPFYESFIMKNICEQKTEKEPRKNDIFSIKNSINNKHKIITIFGIKIKIRRKNA